jgi:hypothetical protein
MSRLARVISAARSGEEPNIGPRATMLAMLLCAVTGMYLLLPVLSELTRPLNFDDAFMFWRYALHFRDGLGMAWNPDGIATYGLTSQLWVFVILPFTASPLTPDMSLKLASTATGLAGLAMLAWAAAVGRGRPAPEIAVALAILLLAIGPYRYHMTTGMDTMLSFLTNTLLVGAVLAWRDGQTGRTILVAIAAFVTILARPENVIVGFGVPILAWLLILPQRRIADIAIALGLIVALLIANLAICYFVYGTPLPLSFYAKSAGSYAGFMNSETPIRYFVAAFPAALPALALLIAFGRRHRKLIVALALPVAATFLYLATVRQIMGFEGRYFLPFLPFIVIPAAIATADNLGRPAQMGLPLAMLFGSLLALQLAQPLVGQANASWLRMTLPPPIASPQPITNTSKSLPRLDNGRAWWIVANRIVAHLPRGTVMAASEVGMVGAASPDVSVIDLAGLNDREIGLYGFSPSRLVERAPALIWLPHEDYTGARAALLGDAEFRDHYQLITGAFNYGLAIRRGAPQRREIEVIVERAWRETYPGIDIRDHVARWPAVKAHTPR